MTARFPLLLALSASLAVAGCQNMSDSPITPDPVGPGSLQGRGNGRGGGGGGDGPPPPTYVPIGVRWTGGGVSEIDARDCENFTAANNGDSGHYGCQHRPEVNPQLLTFALSTSDRTDVKGDGTLCTTFQTAEIMPGRTYTYAWTDNFSDGTSGVQVINWFGDDGPEAHGIAGAGLIKLEAFGTVSGTFADELNPFFVGRTAAINQIEVRIAGVGKNKIIAECHWSVNATFRSDPQ